MNGGGVGGGVLLGAMRERKVLDRIWDSFERVSAEKEK